ncbi:MAG: NADH-quinone oxidoreductase subunit J [Myxococcales bacterium]|nr:NADH-quinone oxidoreductase subunit J [Myxococcales bacterium]
MGKFEIALFALCAAISIAGALVTVGARRPIRSALGLLATILGVAGCYLLLEAQFLAAIQLIVYAGAVVVLFIFVVMLLGSASTSPRDAKSAVPRYIGAGLFLAGSLAALLLILRIGTKVEQVLPPTPAGFGSVEGVGGELFTRYVVPFELAGALLIVAVIGAMAVARGKQPDPTLRPAAEAAGAAPPGASERGATEPAPGGKSAEPHGGA